MDTPPDKLKNAAIAQIIVGVIDVLLSWWLIGIAWSLAGTVVGTCLSIVTLGMCPIGFLLGCFGFLGFLTVPLGIFEIVAGVMSLSNPKGGATLMKIAAYIGVGSVLFGSLASAIGGGVVLMFMGDDEVKRYLEG